MLGISLVVAESATIYIVFSPSSRVTVARLTSVQKKVFVQLPV